MINEAGIINVYNSMVGALTTQVDSLYTSGKIDSETYSKIISQAYVEFVGLAVNAVQNQEKLDKEVELVQANKDKVYGDLSLVHSQKDKITKEILVLGEEVLNKAKEREVLEEQILKITAETTLLGSKATTETKTQAVLAAQATGYANDHKQKKAEIYVRAFSAVATTNALTTSDAAGYGVSGVAVAGALNSM